MSPSRAPGIGGLFVAVSEAMSLAANLTKLRLLRIINRMPHGFDRAKISKYRFQIFVIHIAKEGLRHDGF